MAEIPDFLTPPGDDPTDIKPLGHSRALTNDLAVERNRAMSSLNIETERLLVELAGIQRQLAKGTETIRDHTGLEIEIPLTRDRVSSLKASAEICFGFLKKTLPDLKGIVVQEEKKNDDPLVFEVILDGE